MASNAIELFENVEILLWKIYIYINPKTSDSEQARMKKCWPIWKGKWKLVQYRTTSNFVGYIFCVPLSCGQYWYNARYFCWPRFILGHFICSFICETRFLFFFFDACVSIYLFNVRIKLFDAHRASQFFWCYFFAVDFIAIRKQIIENRK